MTVTREVVPADHADTEPHPEFLEMVGRLAGDYCPALLSTDVVEVARSAFAHRDRDEMHAVEVVARAALDEAVAEPDGDSPVVGPPR